MTTRPPASVSAASPASCGLSDSSHALTRTPRRASSAPAYNASPPLSPPPTSRSTCAPYARPSISSTAFASPAAARCMSAPSGSVRHQRRLRRPHLLDGVRAPHAAHASWVVCLRVRSSASLSHTTDGLWRGADGAGGLGSLDGAGGPSSDALVGEPGRAGGRRQLNDHGLDADPRAQPGRGGRWVERTPTRGQHLHRRADAMPADVAGGAARRRPAHARRADRRARCTGCRTGSATRSPCSSTTSWSFDDRWTASLLPHPPAVRADAAPPSRASRCAGSNRPSCSGRGTKPRAERPRASSPPSCSNGSRPPDRLVAWVDAAAAAAPGQAVPGAPSSEIAGGAQSVAEIDVRRMCRAVGHRAAATGSGGAATRPDGCATPTASGTCPTVRRSSSRSTAPSTWTSSSWERRPSASASAQRPGPDRRPLHGLRAPPRAARRSARRPASPSESRVVCLDAAV